MTNVQQVRDGDVVLMDAGCEVFGYCSDVSRTWPVNGKFTSQQRDLYDLVHDTHRWVCSAPLRMYSMSRGTRSTSFVLLQAVRGGVCARGNIAARPPVVCASAV